MLLQRSVLPALPEHARLMKQYADEVILSYDADGAGQAATHKAINLLGEVGVKTKIIKIDGAKDPDEFIKKFGAMRFKLLLDNSDGAINFELERCKVGLDLKVTLTVLIISNVRLVCFLN